MVIAVRSRNEPRQTQALTAIVTVLVGIMIAGVLVAQHQQIAINSTSWIVWIMAGVAVLAGTQAFVGTPTTSATPAIVCPTIAFTFAILLCFGPGTALIAQGLAVVVVAWRLKRTVIEAVIALGQYCVAFLAAQAVLSAGRPDPLHHHAAMAVVADAITIVGAIGAWLLAFGIVGALITRLRHASPLPAGALGNQLLFMAALLLISPILAVTAHVNIGLVPLVFIPLYAVQRMAKLSAQRDRAARVDPLTGLANRTGLRAASDALAASSRQSDRRTTLLIADLDEFKHVNDALGHEVGDQLLVAITRRLARLPLGPGGVIARLGGDEFAIIDTTRDAAEATALADAVVATLAEPVSLGGIRVDITASIGIARIEDPREDFATLMRHADIAMYDAKKRGNSVAEYQPDAHHDSVERLALLTDFRRALEANDRSAIAMHYQPQVSLVTGDVEAVEALLRWHHPTYGLIPTQELISMAEHSSVMHLLTLRVIDDVVEQLGAWAVDGVRLRASINVSSRDLYDDNIVSYLAARLAASDVEPGQIQLEITEGALLGDPNRAMLTITRICKLGIAVALDDFGTGYSSLQHLRKLPISEIKIDRSFVGGMASNHDDAAIVRSTVELARSLGLRTVAEGVETEYTRQLLAEAGCTLAQGWLTAHPMPADEFRSWINGRKLATSAG